MPEQSGHDLQVHTCGEHQRRVRVAKGVQGNVRKGSVGDELLELPFCVIVVDEVAFGGGKDDFRMREVFETACVFDPELLSLLLLKQESFHLFTHIDLPYAVLRFRRVQPVFAPDVREVPTDVDEVLFKVYIYPTQSEGLSGANSGEQQESND